MKARQIVEHLFSEAAAPAPVAPPKTRPTTTPSPAPAAPAPKPKKFDNPWRRRHVRPGQEPAPKAMRESKVKARDLFK